MDASTLTDEAVARLSLEDKDQFAYLIDRYAAKLTRYLERLGVSVPEDREDILQNAFLKAYRNLASFDPDLSFSSWMYRIVHNEAMSFFRRRRARPEVSVGPEGESLLLEIRDEGADATRRAEERIENAALSRALAELSPQYREVLALRFFEDRSYAEISDILEIPTGTVSTMIHRAKRALAERLATYAPTYEP